MVRNEEYAMSRMTWIWALTVGFCTSASATVMADDAVLQGKILCARCTLKETAKCQTAIQVTQSGKTTAYYFVDRGVRESYHAEICGQPPKEGKVIGEVVLKDGKSWVTPKSVEYLPAKQSSQSPIRATDYRTARTIALKEGKPVAVLIGSGDDGWKRLSGTGGWSPASLNALATGYVALYVDASSDQGRELAKSFDVGSEGGLVISDRSGENQAFHHSGALHSQSLADCLAKHSASGSAASGCVNGVCPSGEPPLSAVTATGAVLSGSGTAAKSCCHK
jgi:hypothetical protein